MMSSPTNPIERLDRPLADVEADAAAFIALKQQARSEEEQRAKASTERLRWLLAHPSPADPGTRAEYRHWLHDEDPDSTVPAFRIDLIKHKTTGGAA